MYQNNCATILAVSEGWEDAYITDTRTDKVYYVRAPYFERQRPVEENILHSSIAYGLIVPEIKDFSSFDAALNHIKSQYEMQEQPQKWISFEKAVDVILDYAKEIKHPLAGKTVKEKNRLMCLKNVSKNDRKRIQKLKERLERSVKEYELLKSEEKK